MADIKFLVIGEVFIDTHLDILNPRGPLVRLGGIFHAARAFYSINAKYSLAYYSPTYLQNDIEKFSHDLLAQYCYKIGVIEKAPNVMLIHESQEAGNQGYYNILKDQAKYIENEDLELIIKKEKPTDILLFPGRYDTHKIIEGLNNLNSRIHIDMHYDSENLLENFTGSIDTVFLSTSSSLFKENCQGSFDGVKKYFESYDIKNILVKENRGGSFLYINDTKEYFEAPSYYVPAMHSVGVGDVFDCIFIEKKNSLQMEKALRFASLCAAKYAETMCVETFKESVQLVIKSNEDELTLKGVRLSWEERFKKSIYIAAPDFPYVNKEPIENLVACLQYHNFRPLLPIRENGLAKKDMSVQEELTLYTQDIKLLYSCDLLIAILLFNDPGTLIELGMFKQMGNPTIIFDPYHICDNLFAKYTPDYLCDSIEEVINSVFLCLSRKEM